MASRARVAAKKAREVTRRKSLEISSLPGKLCSSKKPEEVTLPGVYKKKVVTLKHKPFCH